MKTPVPKPHTDAFWEALVQRGVTPEQAAPHVPDLSELEIAAQMIRARRRIAQAAAGPVSRSVPETSCWAYRVGSAKGKR